MPLRVKLLAISLIVASISLSGLLSGCTGGRGKYVDEGEPTPVTEFFSDTDFRILVDGIWSELAASLSTRRGAHLLLLPIANRTSDRVDMKALTDSIATCFVQSGAFTVINSALREELAKEVMYYADIDGARDFARQNGASLILGGRLSSIVVRTSGKAQVRSYMLTVQVTDVESGLIVASVEREMKKNVKRSGVGL